MHVLLLLVMGMLVVLVVLIVLEERVVFAGGMFKFLYPHFFCENFIESKKKITGAKKI